MKLYRWPIHVSAALALFLGVGVEAQGQEQVASAKAAQKQPATTNALTLPARVRLRLADGSRLTGELLRVDEGRVVVRIDAAPPEPERAIPLAEVKTAQVSRGRHRRVGRGALIGGSIGVVLGAVAGATCDGEGCGDAYWPIVGGSAFGALGALLGAGIGAFVKTDGWEEIPASSLRPASPPAKADNELAETSPDRQVRFAIGPTLDRGVQARFSVSWR